MRLANADGLDDERLRGERFGIAKGLEGRFAAGVSALRMLNFALTFASILEYVLQDALVMRGLFP